MIEELTPREIDMLRWTAQGFTTAEIARNLFLSPETIKTHRKNLIAKMGARNITHCVHLAHLEGLFTTPPPDGSSAHSPMSERTYGHVPYR